MYSQLKTIAILSVITGLAITGPFNNPAYSSQDTHVEQSHMRQTINNIETTDAIQYSSQQSLSPDTLHSLAIWQGFEHEWQRFVVLRNGGRVPHRISKFHNYIQQPENNTSQASFHFAQNTGVDGNYMHPKGNYAAIYSDNISTRSGSMELHWTDTLNNATYPTADSKIREVISVPMDDFPIHDNQQAMILQGIQLDLHCDDNKQPEGNPCNSNGMWPYIFNIAIDQCSIQQENYNCDLSVDIYRAWTPNKGGFQLPPVFEEYKPLNHRLDYSLRVYFSVISGNEDIFSHRQNEDTSISSDIHHQSNHTTTLDSSTPDNQQENMAHITNRVHAITSFGFALSPPEQLEQHWELLGSDTNRQGRYIGKLTNKITDSTISQSLWAPITVVNATSHVTLGSRSLFFTNEIKTTDTQTVQGKLCINSTDQAPAFSKWGMCNLRGWLARIIYGGKEQTSQAILLPAINP